jgi:hypothetical protein
MESTLSSGAVSITALRPRPKREFSTPYQSNESCVHTVDVIGLDAREISTDEFDRGYVPVLESLRHIFGGGLEKIQSANRGRGRTSSSCDS